MRGGRSVGAQAIAIAAGTAASQVVVALMYIFAARSASPSNYGAVVSAIALGMVVAGFVDFGTNSLWVRELASLQMTDQEASRRVAAKVLVSVLIALLLGVAFWFFLPQYLAVAFVMFSVVASQAMLVPLRASRRGVSVAVILVTERVAAAVIFFGSIALGVPALRALVPSLVVGSLVSAVGSQVAARSGGHVLALAIPRRNPWSGSAYYGLSTLANSGQQLDLPLLSLVAGPAAAGIYGAVNRWTQPIGLVAGAFSSAAAPFVAGAKSWAEAVHLVTRSVWMLGVAVASALVVAICSPFLVVFLLGEEYANSAQLLQLLALGTIPAVLNQPLAMALQARRSDRLVAVTSLTCVTIQLLTIAVLGFYFGEIAAGIAYALLQFLLFCALSTSVWRAFRWEKLS